MNDIIKSLAIIGIASVVIHSIMTDKKEKAPQKEPNDDLLLSEEDMYAIENPRQEASEDLDFSRKKRIYIKRLKNAHKQIQLLKGEQNVKEYHRKKPDKKTEKQNVKVKLGDKEFVYKVPIAVKRAKISN